MLIQYFQVNNTMPAWQAYAYATGVVVCLVLYTLTYNPLFFGITHIGMKLRVASCSLLYKKVC